MPTGHDKLATRRPSPTVDGMMLQYHRPTQSARFFPVGHSTGKSLWACAFHRANSVHHHQFVTPQRYCCSRALMTRASVSLLCTCHLHRRGLPSPAQLRRLDMYVDTTLCIFYIFEPFARKKIRRKVHDHFLLLTSPFFFAAGKCPSLVRHDLAHPAHTHNRTTHQQTKQAFISYHQQPQSSTPTRNTGEEKLNATLTPWKSNS